MIAKFKTIEPQRDETIEFDFNCKTVKGVHKDSTKATELTIKIKSGDTFSDIIIGMDDLHDLVQYLAKKEEIY